MLSNVYRLLVSRERAPIAHHPLTITYNYKLSVRLTKMRFLTARVRLFRLQKFQKSIQRVTILRQNRYGYVTVGRVVCVNSNVEYLGLEDSCEGREYTVVLKVTRNDRIVWIGRIGDVAPVVELLTVVIGVRSEVQRRTVSNREVNTRVDGRVNRRFVRSERSGEGLRFLDVCDRTRSFGVTVIPLYEVETCFRGRGDRYTSVTVNILAVCGFCHYIHCAYQACAKHYIKTFLCRKGAINFNKIFHKFWCVN